MNIIFDKQHANWELSNILPGLDNLVFSERIEKVKKVNTQFGEIYTERLVVNNDRDNRKFPFILQNIVYELGNSPIITADSQGRIYESRKIRELSSRERRKINEEIDIQGNY